MHMFVPATRDSQVDLAAAGTFDELGRYLFQRPSGQLLPFNSEVFGHDFSLPLSSNPTSLLKTASFPVRRRLHSLHAACAGKPPVRCRVSIWVPVFSPSRSHSRGVHRRTPSREWRPTAILDCVGRMPGFHGSCSPPHGRSLTHVASRQILGFHRNAFCSRCIRASEESFRPISRRRYHFDRDVSSSRSTSCLIRK